MKLLHDLRNNSSRIAKERLLSIATPLELKVFNYAYDKNKVYHLKDIGDIDLYNLGEPTEAMFYLLDQLLDGTYSGYAARHELDTAAEAYGDLIKLIVRKDLDCGATAKTVNKAHPGTVPMFNVQLAKEAPLSKVEFPTLAQIKYDGVRIIIIKRSANDIKFFTRNGKQVHLPYMTEQLQSINISSFVLDSEVTLKSGKMTDRTVVSGMINSAMHGGSIDETKLVFNVFDAMTVEEWDTSICLRTYKNRFKQEMFILSAMRSDQLIPALTIPCDTLSEVNACYEELIDQGYEGLILKSEDHKYTFKRTTDWVKMKETKSADLICYHVTEGAGKYEGLIGALFCKGVVEDKEVEVFVGSGLSDEQRTEDYTGMTIEVKYNAVIQDSLTKRYSLFLPRFVSVRFDK